MPTGSRSFRPWACQTVVGQFEIWAVLCLVYPCVMDKDFKARRAVLHLMKAVGEMRVALRMLEAKTSILAAGTPTESMFAKTGTPEIKSSLDEADANLAAALKVFDEPD